jgi:small subunit ribosomal protein S3
MTGSAGVDESEAAPARPAGGAEDALEKLLAEEEEIERRTREQHHDLPHFRKETD